MYVIEIYGYPETHKKVKIKADNDAYQRLYQFLANHGIKGT